MSALYRIVYAAHANGTHHKLALDSLRYMPRPDREDWQRLFLKHVELYLEGSKAPDKSFKDFKNHVLHVGEKYWGGAPEKVEAWYGHLVTALREKRWSDAAFAAGVLSHYYTDPIHPFHTGQTEAENSIHRAVEWSINRSYDDLRKIAEKDYRSVKVRMPIGENWLRALVCDGAEYAHRDYEKLIAHYNFETGGVHPEDGLDEIGQQIVARLLMYASKGFGLLLNTAISEAAVAPPKVNLTIDTVLATLIIPRYWLEKRLANNHDRAIVQAMFDELKATGRVEQSLPEDDRMIRDLHAREVAGNNRAERNQARAARIPKGDPAELQRAERKKAVQGRAIAPAVTAGNANDPVTPTLVAKPVGAALETVENDDHQLKTYLSRDDDLEAAPSIGPRMAAKFADIGIMTVADFLDHDAETMADLLDDSRFSAQKLLDWQDQAQLVIDVPGLRGTHAQLLVGAGYHTIDAIVAADPADLSADVLSFAISSEGKRILRNGNPPELEKIKSWITAAEQKLAA